MALGSFDRTPPPFFRQGPSALSKMMFFSALAVLLMVADTRFKLTQPLRAAIATVLLPIERVLMVPVTTWERAGEYLGGLQGALGREQAARGELVRQAERATRVEQLAQRERAACATCSNCAPRLPCARWLPRCSTRQPIRTRARSSSTAAARTACCSASPVINEQGVLGQVTRVYPLNAEVSC